MLVLVAFCLPLCILMAAFAIDVSWMQLVRTELRTATDAAARAGAKTLSMSQNRNTAREGAKQAALRNRVAGSPLRLANGDIVIGVSQPQNGGRFRFTAGGSRPNAVRVTGRRTSGSTSGAVNLLFSRVLKVRSFEPVDIATASQLDRDICLVVDRSGSMMEKAIGNAPPTMPWDCDPPNQASRWAALDDGVNIFLDELGRTLPDEMCAMVSYGSDDIACGYIYPEVRFDADFSTNYSSIRSAIANIGSRPVHGGTHIGEGLDRGVATFSSPRLRPFSVKSIVLMTDGIQNGGTLAIVAARRAAAQNIIVNTITFGDGAAQGPMQEVAAATGGKHYHAVSPDDLLEAFREIAGTMEVLTTE